MYCTNIICISTYLLVSGGGQKQINRKKPLKTSQAGPLIDILMVCQVFFSLSASLCFSALHIYITSHNSIFVIRFDTFLFIFFWCWFRAFDLNFKIFLSIYCFVWRITNFIALAFIMRYKQNSVYNSCMYACIFVTKMSR